MLCLIQISVCDTGCHQMQAEFKSVRILAWSVTLSYCSSRLFVKIYHMTPLLKFWASHLFWKRARLILRHCHSVTSAPTLPVPPAEYWRSPYCWTAYPKLCAPLYRPCCVRWFAMRGCLLTFARTRLSSRGHANCLFQGCVQNPMLANLLVWQMRESHWANIIM